MGFLTFKSFYNNVSTSVPDKVSSCPLIISKWGGKVSSPGTDTCPTPFSPALCPGQLFLQTVVSTRVQS